MSPKNLNVRMTDEEYQKIKEKADKMGMSISEYVRFISIHADIKVKIRQP